MPSPTRKPATARDPATVAAEAGGRLSNPIDQSGFHRRLFELSPDAVFVSDDEGRYVDVNVAACRMTGYSQEEMIQLRVGDLTTPDERLLAEKHYRELLSRGRTTRLGTLLRKNGEKLTVEIRAIDLGEGLLCGVMRDLTPRLAVYDTLFDLCQAALISAGDDARILSWNPAAESLFGYTAAEALGLPLDRLMPADTSRDALASFRRLMGENPDRPVGKTIRATAQHKSGTPLRVELSVVATRMGDQRIVTAVIHDISEQEAVVEKLNDALQQLQFHVERMPLAYIVWDLEFRVVEWNPSAERIFGFARDEAVGKHAYDIIVPQDVIPHVDRVWDSLRSGDTTSHSINVNVRNDGLRITCEWFNTTLYDSAGRIRGVASMVMDVSEREALEVRIRTAQKLESLGVMAAGIAHDFNSSLMVILGNADLIKAVKNLPQRALDHLQLIEESGTRAKELIKHLLAYARTGRHNPQPTDINDVARDATVFVRSSIGKLHELSFTLAPELPPILADRSQVEQIILNLCLNAKQAMPRGGTICVETRTATLSPRQLAECVPHEGKSGPHVELIVSDTGCGMDARTLARIFDPFFTTKPDGHGLGLAAVLGILRQHNAVARVRSEPGKGTSFHVFFPMPTDVASTSPK